MMGLSWPGSRQQGTAARQGAPTPHFTVREGYMDRRDFLRITGASGALCAAGATLAGSALAQGAHRHRLRRLARLRADRRHQHRRSRGPGPPLDSRARQRRHRLPARRADHLAHRGRRHRQPGAGPGYGVRMLAAQWPENPDIRRITVISRFQTRNRRVDLDQPAPANFRPESAATLREYLKPTDLLPTDGIVRPPPTASRAATAAIWRGRSRSTNGWSRTPAARPPPEAAAWATCATCSRPMT